MHSLGMFFCAFGGYIIGNFYENKLNGTVLQRFSNRNVSIGDWINGV